MALADTPGGGSGRALAGVGGVGGAVCSLISVSSSQGFERRGIDLIYTTRP